MRIFVQGQGFREPAAKQWDFVTAKRYEEIKGLRGGVQGIPQIDAEIAEKGHLWTETNLEGANDVVRRCNG